MFIIGRIKHNMSKITNPFCTDNSIYIQVNIFENAFSFSDENIIMGSIIKHNFKFKQFFIKDIDDCGEYYEIYFDDDEQYENLTLDIPKKTSWLKKVSDDEFEIIEKIWTFHVPGDSHIKEPMDLLGYTIKDASDYSSLGHLSTQPITNL